MRNLGIMALLVSLWPGLPAQSEEPDPFRGFDKALPGWNWEFPRDHGSHDRFSTEWWYFTGHLWDEEGNRYGFELTFFRAGIVPPDQRTDEEVSKWTLEDLALTHFALTDVERGTFEFHELLNRQSPWTANAASGDLDVWNGSWYARRRNDGTIAIFANGKDDSIELELMPEKDPVIHGENGLSVKSNEEGYASHYYTLSRLAATGTISSGGRERTVRGLAWMDHEFGSAVLNRGQVGWDWFAVQLDDGSELMVYYIRTADGTPDSTSSGTLIRADGSSIHLDRDDFRIEARDEWRSPASGATYPIDWRIEVPAFGIDLDLEPVLEDQELRTEASTQITYWEGAVSVNGRSGTSPVRGWGYVEMTGYDRPFGATPRQNE